MLKLSVLLLNRIKINSMKYPLWTQQFFPSAASLVHEVPGYFEALLNLISLDSAGTGKDREKIF